MKKQKIILITGCSSGIGLDTAIYLSGKGHKVYASMRNLDKKDRLLFKAKETGVLVEILVLDVTSEESIKKAVGAIIQKEGKIDVLVNNAGYGSGGFLEDFSMREIREQFETNFFGLVGMIKEVLPFMRKQRSGCIVNISSIGGIIAFPAIGVYNASKFAVEAITESLRIELAPFGIKVTAIEPLSIKTNFYKSVKAAENCRKISSPYFEYFKRFEKNTGNMANAGEDAASVAKTINDAISSDNPKRSYPVGRGARIFLLLKIILPNSIFEKIIGKAFFV